MTELQNQKRKAETIKDWLNHPGWEIVSKEIEAEADQLNSRMINSDDDAETKNLKYEIRAIKKFLNKIISYSEIK